MLYRASEHNFTANSFHEKCENHGPTITIIESNFGNIFGGYLDVPWPTINEKSIKSRNMFLFLLKSNHKLQTYPIIIPIKKNAL